jgi:8-oxo-dGTP pyrophosphatase MutT (NUDIX family)
MQYIRIFAQTIISSIADIVRGVFIPPARVQFAALPFREGDNGLEYMLVTSRDTGRWIIPKGWPTTDGNPLHTVADEAWEEAGVLGEVQPTTIGEFVYRKRLDAGHEIDCRVVVYPFKVKYVAHAFPEFGLRERQWVSPEDAARRVDEPELRSILLDCKRLGMLSLP